MNDQPESVRKSELEPKNTRDKETKSSTTRREREREERRGNEKVVRGSRQKGFLSLSPLLPSPKGLSHSLTLTQAFVRVHGDTRPCIRMPLHACPRPSCVSDKPLTAGWSDAIIRGPPSYCVPSPSLLLVHLLPFFHFFFFSFFFSSLESFKRLARLTFRSTRGTSPGFYLWNKVCEIVYFRTQRQVVLWERKRERGGGWIFGCWTW